MIVCLTIGRLGDPLGTRPFFFSTSVKGCNTLIQAVLPISRPSSDYRAWLPSPFFVYICRQRLQKNNPSRHLASHFSSLVQLSGSIFNIVYTT